MDFVKGCITNIMVQQGRKMKGKRAVPELLVFGWPDVDRKLEISSTASLDSRFEFVDMINPRNNTYEWLLSLVEQYKRLPKLAEKIIDAYKPAQETRNGSIGTKTNLFVWNIMATTNATITPSPNKEISPSPVLQDRIAIVTGSSRGIGKEIAIHLAALGANVVVNYTSNKAQAVLVADEINSTSPGDVPKAIVVQADVSDPAQVKLLFDEAEKVFGSQVHVLVNSAAITDSKYPTIANTCLEDFDRIFSVNCRGTFLCCKEAANRIKRGGGGRIILLSSSLVRSLKPNIGTYTATKAAVEAMAKVLAKELKGTRITANCVAPGPVATEMFFAGLSEERVKGVIEECPLGRLGETKDVAPVVGFLASDAGEWINGQTIVVNGGLV